MVEAYLRNCWYQAAWAYELDNGILARTLLDIPVVLVRAESEVFALRDQCPHRFAPLSAGKVQGNAIVCGYHGLAFDGTGQCTMNPHGPITSTMCVRSFPVIERHTAIWIWMGDAERADEALIPNLSFIDETTELGRIPLYMPTAANYRLLTDNIMDLSHADFLHSGSLGGTMADATFRFFERGTSLVAEWINIGCAAPGMFQAKVPSPAKADFWIEVAWQPPAVMVLRVAVVPTGAPRDPIIDVTTALHNMTPETAKTSHYFACGTRRTRLDDAEYSAMHRIRLQAAFIGEDKPMLELQQASMGDAEFWSLKPLLLRIDTAAVQIRRKLDALLEAEALEKA